MKSVSKQPSVRVNLSAKKKLEQIQACTDRSQTVLLDHAIDLLEREMLAQQIETDFTYLANSGKALRQYNKIATVFEGATADSLHKK